jgi:hypothetical protein
MRNNMGMKPPMHEPFGPIGNAVTEPKKKGHYDGVQNAVTTMKQTGNPNAVNAGAGTTTKGPVPTP